MSRARGLIQDDRSIPRNDFQLLRKRLGSVVIGHSDLYDYAPSIVDQNEVSSCVYCAIPRGAATALAANGTPLPWEPSVREAYAMGLGLDRARENPLTPSMLLEPLQDVGSMLLTGVQVLNHWGVVASGPDIKIGDTQVHCDCGPDNWHKEAKLLTLEKARRKLIVGAYQVLFDIEKSCMLSLDARHTVVLGNFVDRRHFEEYSDNSDPLGSQDLKDPEGGGHCTYLTGYRLLNGRPIFEGVNSWGIDWGRRGRFEAYASFLLQAEIIALDVTLIES